MYADYGYYREQYLGKDIPEAEFPRLSRRAGEYLDRLCRGRLRLLAEIPAAVKDACCAVAEQELLLEQRGDKSRETVGGYTVVWDKEPEGLRLRAAARHLWATGLLYAGCSLREEGQA